MNNPGKCLFKKLSDKIHPIGKKTICCKKNNKTFGYFKNIFNKEHFLHHVHIFFLYPPLRNFILMQKKSPI